MKRLLIALAVAALLIWATLPALASQDQVKMPNLRTEATRLQL